MTAGSPPRSIGIVLHDLPLGGTERIALRLARAWAALGIEVVLFVGLPEGPLAPLVPAGVRLVAADPPLPRGLGSRGRLGRAAARHFAAEPVDALFVIGNWHWEVVPALATLRPRLAIVAQQSSPLAMPRRGRWRQWRFERRMRRTLRGADAVVAMDAASARLADRILGRTVSRVIPLPAIDDDPPPPSPPPPPHEPLVLAAGRLIRQKGFDLLIDAMAPLPDVRLTIVGDGPERARLARRIARRRLAERVTLAGFAPDIRPWLDAARLFVLPSRFEGYGAVIVEALAAGRPVVATRTTPAVDDLLGPPERGRVVPPGDAAALTQSIRALLAAPPPDPATLAAATGAYRLAAGAADYLDLFAATRA